MKTFLVMFCVALIMTVFGQEYEKSKLRETNSVLVESLEKYENTLKDLSKANRKIKELEKIRDKYYHECLPEIEYEIGRNYEQK